MTEVRTEVTTEGPFFDGRHERQVLAAVEVSERAIADAGVQAVQRRLGAKLANPTGYYESQIQTDRAVTGFVVTDGGVIYGPWLEGVTSRNEQTRFKGYSHFRRATQELAQTAARYAEPIIDRAVT